MHWWERSSQSPIHRYDNHHKRIASHGSDGSGADEGIECEECGSPIEADEAYDPEEVNDDDWKEAVHLQLSESSESSNLSKCNTCMQHTTTHATLEHCEHLNRYTPSQNHPGPLSNNVSMSIRMCSIYRCSCHAHPHNLGGDEHNEDDDFEDEHADAELLDVHGEKEDLKCAKKASMSISPGDLNAGLDLVAHATPAGLLDAAACITEACNKLQTLFYRDKVVIRISEMRKPQIRCSLHNVICYRALD